MQTSDRHSHDELLESDAVPLRGLLTRLLPRSGTQAAGHVVWLDGWRGLCILLVLLGHFGPASLDNLGPFGVELFFVLSGRLMAEMLIVRRQALPTFLARRASRILPLLLFYVTVVAIGLGFAQLLAGASVNWLSPAASLLFFSNYLPIPSRCCSTPGRSRWRSTAISCWCWSPPSRFASPESPGWPRSSLPAACC